MINTKRPNTSDYTQVGFLGAKDGQGNYQNIDHIYDSEGNIVFQQGYLNEYDGANDFRIPAIGKPLIDYTIYGNTFQDGIPTPDNPIMPEGTGDRTGNLCLVSQSNSIYYSRLNKYSVSGNSVNITGEALFGFICAVSPNTEYSVSARADKSGAQIRIREYSDIPTEWQTNFVKQSVNISLTTYNSATFTTDTSTNYLLVVFYTPYTVSSIEIYNIMLNTGSTAKPYEPYGYKIPISSANTTTPVYLGEVQSTRRIKKLVLTGEENIKSGTGFIYVVANDAASYTTSARCICTHYPQEGTESCINTTNQIRFYVNSDVDTFKAYLAAQYAAGTPVCVWYVLKNEETAVVNEPLMKIGGYADSVDFSQAGVEIPTLKRPNTTEIDITTSLPPSEVYAKYRGSKTQKYDLFLAANGDSFEAKNGQSLYIGDDT